MGYFDDYLMSLFRSEGKDYMMRLGPQVYVDATHYPQVLARYINDCRNPKGYNVQFIKLPEEKKALVVALHDLEPVGNDS